MKPFLILLSFLFVATLAFPQDAKKPYNPDADVRADLKTALAQANKENKNVFIQVGGNWCPWCIIFHDFIHDNAQVDSTMAADYVFMLMNYERKETKNLDLLAELGYPQRFGFPVFVILDKTGKVVHIQDSSLLEKGKSYDLEKVLSFLRLWSPMALNPETYKVKKDSGSAIK